MNSNLYNNIEIEHRKFMPIIYKMIEINEYIDDKILKKFRKIFNEDIENIKSHISSFTKFTMRLYTFCKTYADYFEIEEDVLKGDLFEIFVEIFLKINGNNEKVLINNYSVIHDNEDTQDVGVDGIGFDMNNDRCSIQIKYRNHSSPRLTKKSITQFIGASIINYGVNPYLKSKSFVLITNTKKEVDYRINKISNDRLKVIDGNVFDMIIGKSKTFWNILHYVINNNYDKKRNVVDCPLIREYEDLFFVSRPVIKDNDSDQPTYEERKQNLFDNLV